MKRHLYNIRLISLAIIGIAALAASAQDVTYSQAQAIAADFFQSNGIDAPAAAMHRAKGAAPASNGNSPYYIINADNAFAIIAGDSRISPILGYSFDGTFDDSQIAPGLADVLAGYEDYVLNLAAGTEQVRYASLPPLAQDKILPTATWNQNPSPWFDKCPQVDGSRSVAGCVATAMSIVMRYHRWPVSTGYGTPKTYTSSTHKITSTADFANTDYKIATIPTDGRWGMTNYWSDAEKEAVATLLFHAGVAASMDYSPSGSGASDVMALTGVASHFGYKLGGWARKSSYTDENFLTLIISEIDADRPTLYSGSSDSGGGHMFVCDGYDTDYKLHFNFGWSGSGNGYYSILDNSMDYHNSQEAVIGIIPEPNAATVRPDLVYFPEIGDNCSSFSVSHPSDNSKHILVTGRAFSTTHENTPNVRFSLVLRDAGKNTITRYDLPPATVPGDKYVDPVFNILLPDSYTIQPGDGLYLLYSTDSGATWSEVNRYDGKNYFNMEDLNDPSLSVIQMINYGSCLGLHLPEGSSINNEGTSFNVTLDNPCCISYMGFNGKIAIFLCDKDDNQIKMVSSPVDFNLSSGYYYDIYSLGCSISSDTELARGYRLVACQLPFGSDEWFVIDCDDHSKYYIPIPDELIPTTQTVAFFGVFSTFSSKRDLDFSGISSFNAYAVRMVDAETLALDKLNEVKAGVGVLLMGNAGIDHYVDYPSIMEVPGIAPEENLMVGVLDDTLVDNDPNDAGANYVFKTSPDVGFFLASGETVSAGHAYMRIPSSPWGAPAKFVFMSGDAPDGILSAVADTPATPAIYNLQGIPVTRPIPGAIYIINGKKVIIK